MDDGKKKHRKIHEFDPSRDMKYRGPLSYRHFKILGWLCIALSQVGVLLSLGSRLSAEMAPRLAPHMPIVQILGNLALPLLLFANYAIILNAREGYKQLLIRYAALVAAIALVFMVIYTRYFRGTLALVGTTPEEILELAQGESFSGFLAFNIFVDLFLCTLFMFFLNYRPRALKEKQLILFRLLALLPILYEIVSILLKIWAIRGQITLPVWVYPLLTTKPPLAFLMFTLVGLILKKRERRFFRKGGGSQEDYEVFWNSNTNSWHFSVITSLIIFVTAVLDLITYILMTTYFSMLGLNLNTATSQQITEAIEKNMRLVAHLGIGDSIGLVFIIPLLLLFSYTRRHKNNQIDTLIPLGGVVLILIIYLEGGYELMSVVLPQIMGR